MTVDDAEVLEGGVFDLLASLAAEECEAVIVHRGSSQGSRRRLSRHPVVVEVLSSPPAGPSRARNAALRWAYDHYPPRTVVSFPDDDCSYPRGLVARAVTSLEGVDFVAGAYSPDPPELEPGRFPSASVNLAQVPFSAPIACASLFCRLGPLKQIRGFHEGVGPATAWDSGEEHDLVVRLIRAGFVGRYDPSIVVRHDHVDRAVQERRTAWIGLNTSYFSVDPRFAAVAARAWARLASDVVCGRLSMHDAAGIAAASLDRTTIRAVRDAYRAAGGPA